MDCDTSYVLLVFDLETHANKRRRMQLVGQRNTRCRLESLAVCKLFLHGIETSSYRKTVIFHFASSSGEPVDMTYVFQATYMDLVSMGRTPNCFLLRATP